MTIYDTIRELYFNKGLSKREIAKRLMIHRNTVTRAVDREDNEYLLTVEKDRLFALAVSVMLYIIALAWAPLTVFIVIKFFRPIVKFLRALSQAELSIGTSPSLRNTLRYSSWFILYLSLIGLMQPIVESKYKRALRYTK